jgi:hypothetical protein
MRFALSLLGQEVFAVSLSRDDVTTEDVAEIIARAVEGSQPSGDIQALAGGTHERDHAPITPEDRYRDQWEEDRFGFGE